MDANKKFSINNMMLAFISVLIVIGLVALAGFLLLTPPPTKSSPPPMSIPTDPAPTAAATCRQKKRSRFWRMCFRATSKKSKALNNFCCCEPDVCRPAVFLLKISI